MFFEAVEVNVAMGMSSGFSVRNFQKTRSRGKQLP